MPYFLLAAVLVVLDQIVMLLIRHNIALGESVTLIPGVMDLTYVQNTGAAFSLFRQHTWILAVISLVVAVLIVIALLKRVFTRPFGVISLAVVLAGAVGNLIDRAFFGYVTDMFQTIFMNFAVFNVADICVVVGGFAAVLYYLFFYEKLEGRPKDSGAPQEEQA